MLTKSDKEYLDKSTKNHFLDFWENVVEPYLVDQNKTNTNEHKKTREHVEELVEYIKDHEKRIRKLETVTGV